MRTLLDILVDCATAGVVLSVAGCRLAVEFDGELPLDLLRELKERRDDLLEFMAEREAIQSVESVAEVLAELMEWGCEIVPDDERPGGVMLTGDWGKLPDELVERCDAMWETIKDQVLGVEQ